MLSSSQSQQPEQHVEEYLDHLKIPCVQNVIHFDNLVLTKKRLGTGMSDYIRLLHCKGNQLILDETALKLLSTIDKPVAVLSICGPGHSGKSYYLSQILGNTNVSTEAGAFTEGIWMSTVVLECENFTLLLLDTKGIQSVMNEDRHQKTDLTKLLVLLSSYLVYNSTGSVKQTEFAQLR